MRIISYLNVSNLSNLEADSGFIFQKFLLKELSSKGHDVYLIGPNGMPGLDDSIHPISISFAGTKYGVRFTCDYERLRLELIKIEPCDVLLVNQSELAIPLKTVCLEVWNKAIPCVTYFHYLAIQGFENGKPIFDPSLNLFNLGSIIWQRQLEAFHFSEMNIIGSFFGKKLFEDALSDKALNKNLIIIPPSLTTIYGDIPSNIEASVKSIVTVLYNHRLYSHYGGIEVFKFLEEIYTQRQFKLIVTDPTQNRSSFRKKLDSSVCESYNYLKNLPFVDIKHYKTQEEYFEELHNVDFGIGPLRTGPLWSMSVMDMLSIGKPVIGYDSGATNEMIKDVDLLFRDKNGFIQIFLRLLQDSEYRQLKGEAAKRSTLSYSSDLIAGKFEKAFELILAEK